jgi:general secretion pathway protein D
MPLTAPTRSTRRALALALLAALATLGAGCGTVPRSVKALPDSEPVALQQLGDKAAAESAMLSEQQARLRRDIERMAPVAPPAAALAPVYDPLENRVVTINMNEASVNALLWALAEQLGMNLIIDPSVQSRDQRASLYLKNVTAREVYNHILAAFDLHGETRGGTLVVSPMQERVFQLDTLNSTTSLEMSTGGDVFGAGASAAGGGESLRGTLIMDGSVGKENDPYKQLSATIEGILKPDPGLQQGADQAPQENGRFTLDPLTGTLFVRARPSQVRAIAEVIERNQRILGRQVLVEAQLIDVQLSDQFQFGVDWTLLRGRVAGIFGDAPIQLDPVAGSLPGPRDNTLDRLLTIPRQTIGSPLGRGAGIGYTGDTFSAALNVLRGFGNVKVLSNPSIRVRNATPAYLSVGRNIRYVSKSTTSFSNPGGGATNTSADVQTESLFAGVVIGVAPLIHDDGKVEMLVHPMQTDVAPGSLDLVDVGNGNAVTLPIISFKGMTTTLNLRDGDTVLMGGLIDQQAQNSDNGVPGLSDVPGLGKLFGAETRSHDSRELVMVLRVTVL